MPVSLNGFPMWLCHLCGYFWLRFDHHAPARCACCASPHWKEDPGDAPELPGA